MGKTVSAVFRLMIKSIDFIYSKMQSGITSTP